MTGVRLHHSNRLEVLAAGLARLMRAEPGDPFASERIVVPHPTMGRWLSLELAHELGIAANVRFEQPAEFAWSIMRGVVPDLAREQPYLPARLRWRIHDLLPGLDGEPGGGTRRGGRPVGHAAPIASRDAPDDGGGAPAPGSAVAGYLRDGDPRKRLELADRLARMYDKCLLYRPDWIREWESGPAPHWQARLWQLLVAADGTEGAHHWVNALDRFRAGLRERDRTGGSERTATAPPPESPQRGPWSADSPRTRAAGSASWAESPSRPPGWPRRACFFAVPSLSPSYLELICEAAREIEIHLFALNPCREYWGDIHSRREIDYRAGAADPDARYLTEGNELLAAWGRAGRDSIDGLVEVHDAEWEEHFVEPPGARRLAAVQRDILDLRLAREAARPDGEPDGVPGRAPDGAPATPRGERSSAAEPAPDDSIQVHVCHSPVREAEVLHDRLLAAFDAHPDLEPADVLVLAPDLDVYGPAVEAVFASAGRVPCHVARARAVESRTMRAFLDLLSLPASRQGAETVLAPLAAPAIQARFGFGDADAATIREWVREAGIRWGVDEAHRGEEGLPATADHTWRHGLRRLLLGYAMADAGAPVAGLVPCRAGEAAFGIGETDGELLGRFVSYCESVLGLRHRLGGRRGTAHWAAGLRALVRDFLADGSEPVERGAPIRRTGGSAGGALARELADEVGAVRALIREFENEASAGESPVPVEVVVDVLRERMQGTAREAARLTHGVTVASLGAGRIFPAGVVCVVGMNDGVFPRSPSAPSFDVVAAGRARRGDRDVRYEDRFAFLEALLAARRCFIVTYAGRGLRDDAPIPPSVLVDELKDYLGRRFPGESVEIRHPLQPFSPRCFEATGDTGFATRGLFSYSHGMCEAANVLRAARTAEFEPQSRFAGVELPEPDASRRRVDLADLVGFFANPTRYFLRERLGVRLELDDLALEDEEPFELDGLERHRLQSDVWSQVQAGVEPERGAALLHGSGRLPQAGLGRIVHEDAREEVEPLEALLAPYRRALQAPSRSVDLDLGGFRIVGAIEHVAPDDGAPGAHESCEPGSGGPGPRTMVWWRLGRLRARDRIEVWLRQLAWMAAGHGPLEAVVVSRDRKSWRPATFSPPEDAREHLGRWLDAWWRGQSAPLPVFPETSLAYANAIVRAEGDGDALAEAAREKAGFAWYGDQFTRGECRDPYLALVYESGDPLTGGFEDLAERLLVPLARAQS
ncbi:MAG: exodeoxyribonuclease V subunit gamma [Chromatiales bacterium]|nr:exodeoxyribonuclease V subunit gamma [Chromatiales bacterium]